MRIDIFLTKNKFVETRSKAQALIENGLVFVNGKEVKKSSFDVCENDNVVVKEHEEYVSRGAYKLLGAIKSFGVSFDGKRVLDMGSSTGGFTQVCLKNGAREVVAVDVGKGELHPSIKENKNVISLEGKDIRTVTKAEMGEVDIIVGDLSFISLTTILPHIVSELGKKEMVLLFKPQFECGKEIAKKCRGVVKDEKLHQKLLQNFVEFVKILGLEKPQIAKSPILGGDGNTEFLIYFSGK